MLGPIWSGAASAEEVEWEPPVDAPVTDPFRPPASPYATGNRGIEYGLTEPTDIRAPDDGRVTFAGQVGGTLHVVIDHGGGLVSTLAYLQAFAVVRGQLVRAGDVVGRAGEGFHLTARLDGVYIDPQLLLDGADISVALVAGPAPPGGVRAPERHPAPNGLLRELIGSTLATAHGMQRLSPAGTIRATADAVSTWYRDDCTSIDARTGVGRAPDGRTIDLGMPPAPHDRILIQVAGLGSTSESASIGDLDAAALGYRRDNVVGFSYAGGCTPAPFGAAAAHGPPERPDRPLVDALDARPYVASDTFQDVQVSAERLVALVEDVARRRPGVPIDIAAHSLGGVVTRLAVEMLATDGRADLLGQVTTIASPHRGAQIATTATAAAPGLDLLDQVGRLQELRSAPSVRQLAEVGPDSLASSLEPPGDVRVLAVAGALDPIVGARSAIWDGATNVVVPGGTSPANAHSAITGDTATREAIRLAMSGMPAACVALAQIAAATAVSLGIAGVEAAGTVAAGALAWIV